MELFQSNQQALVVTRNGCVHSISTVIHDVEGKGTVNGHGHTMHINCRDFLEDGYAIDMNGNMTSEYVEFAFRIDSNTFDRLVNVLGHEAAVKAVFNVFQLTDWQKMMGKSPLNEQLLGIFNKIITVTGMSIWKASHEPEKSILAHTITFDVTADVI